MRSDILNALESVYDPEFGISVWDMGLIYSVDEIEERVRVVMTLTTKHCPAGDVIKAGIVFAVEQVVGIGLVDVELVWEPEWNASMISDKGRQELER